MINLQSIYKFPVALLVLTLVLTHQACGLQESMESQSRLSGNVTDTQLADLDAALESSGATHLIQFLSDVVHYGEYREKMISLLGSKLTEEKFDWVRKDILRVAHAEGSADFIRRTWDRDFYGDQITIHSTNQKIQAPKSANTLTDLLAEAATFASRESTGLNADKVKDFCESFTREYETATASASSPKLKGQFFGKVKKSPEVKKAMAWMMSSVFEDIAFTEGPAVQQELVSAADAKRKILKKLTELSTGLGCRVPSIGEIAADHLFSKEFLGLAKIDKTTFAIEFDFVPTTRALHSYWKGVPCDECVGGKTESGLTPGRWATASLPGSLYYAVHKRARGEQPVYLGFLQLIPVRDPSTGLVYGSIEASAPELSKVNSNLVSNGQVLRGTVIDAFLFEFARKQPENWAGIAKGNGRATASGGVSHAILNSESYKKGTQIAGPRELKHFDEAYAAFIVRMGHNRGSAGNYGGNLFTDATARGGLGREASQIRSLATDALTTHDYTLRAHPDELHSALQR